MSLNLHNIVRSTITSIVPDVTCTLYVSTGEIEYGTRGEQIGRFYEGIYVSVQMQSMKTDEIEHRDRMLPTTTTRKAYLYASSDWATRPWAQWRPLGRSGDYILDDKGAWWYVDAVIEDFSRQGWVSLQVTLQTTPVTLNLDNGVTIYAE